MGDEPHTPPGDTTEILSTDAVDASKNALPPPAGKSSFASTCVTVPDKSHFTSVWFDGTAQPPLPDYLLKVLEEHNRRLPKIEAIRAAIIAQAEAELPEPPPSGGSLLFGVLETIHSLYDQALDGAEHGTMGQSFDNSTLVDLLKDRPGHEHVYDPWNGWWAGPYDSLGTKFYNLHIWDQTVPVNVSGQLQHVQGVTQVEAAGQWFGSPGRLATTPDAAKGKGQGGTPASAKQIDFAVNVWTPNNGLTGYVRKDIFGIPQSMPHAGFLIDDNILLWAALVEPDGGEADGREVDLFLFAEPGFADASLTGRYSIRGARGKAKWEGARMVITQLFDEVGQHAGDYRAVKPFADRASLECAIIKNQLGGMSENFAKEVRDKTR